MSLVEHSKCGRFHLVKIVLDGVTEVLYCTPMIVCEKDPSTREWLG